MISTIKLNEKHEHFKTNNGESIKGLNRINIFVGANNSGKSRMMRTLFYDDYEFQIEGFDSKELARILASSKDEVVSLLLTWKHIAGVSFIIQELNNFSDFTYINVQSKIPTIDANLSSFISTLTEVYSNIHSHDQGLFRITDAISILNELKTKLEPKVNLFSKLNLDFKNIYLPILRGLRPIQFTGQGAKFEMENVYEKRILKDYFQNDIRTERQIFTGLDLYKKVTSLLLGDTNDRKRIKEFETFLSVTFFNKKEVNLVPREGHDVLNIKIGEEERPIFEVGDGIQSIIILTYPLFFNEGENCIFHFEEPEMHLHPGLQRIFIETLRDERFKSFQYFMTTHSNHFLDLSLEYDDISIYSFQKEIELEKPVFRINQVTDSHIQLLDQLGVRNSSVFLSNCTIWVEGITDRIYIRRYLELLQEKEETNYKEDLHYSFIEYAGNNITHWSFLDDEDSEHKNINVDYISNKIFLIADNDGVDIPHATTKVKKKLRLELLEKKLGDRFYKTECIEIENLLSKHIIQRFIEKKEGKELDFSKFAKKDFANVPLGKFIVDNVIGLQYKYEGNHGTIHDKINFCKMTTKEILSYDDLSSEAKTLTQKILAFIKKSNP